MELKHIDIARLTVSAANMRGKGKADIANILPSVRARGILVPLMVRPNGAPDSYEVVAGKRRFAAACLLAEENGGEAEPLPCAILDEADDAAALEASLIENVARLDPDEVTRWETFTRLVKEGRAAEEIALTFGLTEVQVKRTLALGNLLPRIRTLYRDEQIDPVTIRHLTIVSKAQSYRDEGWTEAVVLEPGSYFHSWEHERRSKRQGGKVFIALSHRGDVAFHEGYVSTREARKAEQAETGRKPKRPELTAPIQNYLDLHRHAVVRARLAEDSGLAFRLVLAHAIVGSGLWTVRVEPQKAASEAIGESVETCSSEAAFDTRRRAVLEVLGFDADAPTVTGGYDGDCGLSGLLMRLLGLSDEAVLEALAVVMAETLEAGTALVETLGRHLRVDMADHHAVDGTLLDLVKDREVLDALVGAVAGREVAEANVKATGKVKRQILADCLAGTNGRAKVERFVPRWMAFPPSAYTDRGGVATVSRAATVEALFACDDGPDGPDAGGEALAVPDELAEAA
jgi:ParB family chromosome partitioning protein